MVSKMILDDISDSCELIGNLIPYGSTCTFLILTAAKSGIIYFILQTTSETRRSEETYPKLHS